MPWEKQFNVDETLKKAMLTFWSNGYEATSMQNLVDAMGINRGSIYDTFGDKRSLYLEALKRYDKIERKAVLASITKNHPPREAIQMLFDALISEAIVKKNRDGCFLVNTALELAPHDKDMAKVVSNGFKEIEQYFRDLIEQGQANGEINTSINASEVARMLLAAMISIRVLSRSWQEKTVLNSIATQALAMLV